MDNRDEAAERAIFIISQNQMIGKKDDWELVTKVDFLMSNFLKNHPAIAKLCKDITLTEELGKQLIYSNPTSSRPYRMLMYVLLLNETANLKNNPRLAYHLLKEAYLMTDNIYGQLKDTTYPFVLADHLTELEKVLPNRNSEDLLEEEKSTYDDLPQKIKVYRGMCDDEKQTGQFGISWTLDKKDAQNYVFILGIYNLLCTNLF